MARALLVLCTALLATARAVTYGEPGVGSQYQLFGRPITDTSAIHSRSSTVVPGQMPAQMLALEGEGDAQQTAAKAVGAGAAAKQKCEDKYLFSEVFGKCLPAPGTDGFIGATEHEKGKGKALPPHSGVVPISSVAMDVHMPLPLRAIPIKSLPLRTAALNRAPQPQPTPQPSQIGAGGQAARAVAPVRQLRLACPAGFTFQPAMGACIAPTSMFGPQQLQQAMAMRRGAGDDDDDDDNDDGDELRRELMMRARRHRMRHRMFGRRFGGPRILAPVFVFVLPPNTLDRNATMRLGQHFGRVHEVHPSFVGGGAGEQRTAPGSSASPSGPAAAETPTTKPATPAPAPADKPKGSPAGTGTGAGEEPPKALRGAFVNPIVTGSSGGKALPLKATTTGTGDESQTQTQTRAQPLTGADRDSAADVPALQKRAEFISPFVAQTQTRDTA